MRDVFNLRWRKMLRKRFAVRPHRAVFEMFFLPDRHRSLKRVNQPSTGVESSGAMRRENGDQNAALADFDSPKTVHDCGITNGKTLLRLRRKLPELLHRHALVSVVLEI